MLGVMKRDHLAEERSKMGETRYFEANCGDHKGEKNQMVLCLAGIVSRVLTLWYAE